MRNKFVSIKSHCICVQTLNHNHHFVHRNVASLISFFLIIYSGDDEYFEVDFNDEDTLSKFNKSATWGFLAHGWFGTCYRGWPIEMMKVLTAAEPMNLCCVDWSEWAKCNYVLDAEIFVYAVANYVASTINLIHFSYDIPYEIFLVLGHSFGGIMVGIIGQYFTNPQLSLCIGKLSLMMNIERKKCNAYRFFPNSLRSSWNLVHKTLRGTDLASIESRRL